MITINMMCVPQGIGILRFDILRGSIWTSDDNQFHCYSLTDADDIHYQGQFPKTFSGHKNPYRLLAANHDDIQARQDGT